MAAVSIGRDSLTMFMFVYRRPLSADRKSDTNYEYKCDYKINHFYFPVENGVVEVRMVYKENVVLDEMKKALESIARK